MNPLAYLPSLTDESSLIQAELGFVLLLSLAALVAIISRRIRLPYTVALVIVGLALTLVPNPFEFDLSSELILAIIVPPLIFEATLSLKWNNLKKDLGIILILAVIGTFIGAFINQHNLNHIKLKTSVRCHLYSPLSETSSTISSNQTKMIASVNIPLPTLPYQE